MITKVSTKDMTREDWLKARTKSIGGSDAASILGLNSYNSAYSLWCEKTGALVKDDISDREAVRLGNDLEQYVAQRWMEATGKKVRRENNIIYNSKYPFAHANPDRMVIGESAGLECKTTSSWEVIKQLREGEIPPHWYCQCVHYMMVLGAERWYLGALAFGAGFFEFTIERDEAEIDALADAERDFWHDVCNHIAPAPDGTQATTEAIKTIFRESAPGTMADLSAVGHHVEALVAMDKQIKELKSMREECANHIKTFMGQSERGEYRGIKISWKATGRKTFDRAAFESVNGKIPEQYFKHSEERSFRVSKGKEK